MQNATLPATHQTIMPYLIVKNAAGLLDFLKEVFGAEEVFRSMRDEATIAHAEVQVGGSTIMFAETTDQFSTQPAGLFIYVDSADATYEKALAVGAQTIMPPANQEYGRSCGVTDPFGNTWWITSL